MEKDNRLEILRLVAIILVIVVHISNRYCLLYPNIDTFSYVIATIFNSISRVCVPIFFMISGAVMLNKKYDKKKYISRIKRLLIVLISWTIIYFLFSKIIDYPIMNYTNIIKSLFIPIRNHMWFMYAIIGLYIAQPFLNSMISNLDKEKENLFIKLWMFFAGISFLLNIFLNLINIKVKVSYPVPLFNATYYLGYFVAGYLIYKRIDKIKISNKLLALVMTISFLINIILTCLITFNEGSHYELMHAYCSIFNMLPSISLFILVLRNFKDKKREFIDMVSSLTLGIYLSHMIFMDLVMKYFEIKNINAIIGIPIITLTIFILSFIIVYIIKKIPYIKNIC